jgi:hypothetical protein
MFPAWGDGQSYIAELNALISDTKRSFGFRNRLLHDFHFAYDGIFGDEPLSLVETQWRRGPEKKYIQLLKRVDQELTFIVRLTARWQCVKDINIRAISDSPSIERVCFCPVESLRGYLGGTLLVPISKDH